MCISTSGANGTDKELKRAMTNVFVLRAVGGLLGLFVAALIVSMHPRPEGDLVQEILCDASILIFSFLALYGVRQRDLSKTPTVRPTKVAPTQSSARVDASSRWVQAPVRQVKPTSPRRPTQMVDDPVPHDEHDAQSGLPVSIDRFAAQPGLLEVISESTAEPEYVPDGDDSCATSANAMQTTKFSKRSGRAPWVPPEHPMTTRARKRACREERLQRLASKMAGATLTAGVATG